MFLEHKARILESLDAVRSVYYEKETFGGHSLYFHVQSLAMARKGEFDRFAECSYAMLAAWGMHRMGSGGSKEISAYRGLSLSMGRTEPSSMIFSPCETHGNWDAGLCENAFKTTSSDALGTRQ